MKEKYDIRVLEEWEKQAYDCDVGDCINTPEYVISFEYRGKRTTLVLCHQHLEKLVALLHDDKLNLDEFLRGDNL